MKRASAPVALALGVSAALVERQNGCAFQLTANGPAAGSIGQINDGQARIGGGYYASSFTLDPATGLLKDGAGRGCILTPQVTQFQCDAGVPGMTHIY
jgi:hypothetical protein